MFLTVFFKICSHWKAYAKDWKSNHCTHCTLSLLHFSTMIQSPWNVLLFHFLSAHCAFTVHPIALSSLLCVRSQITKRSPCAHYAFTKRSYCTHRLFSFHLSFSPFSFIFIRNSKVKGSVFASHNKVRKECMHKGRRKLMFTHQKHHISNENKNVIAYLFV